MTGAGASARIGKPISGLAGLDVCGWPAPG